jgi:predicted PurR-regulated permease PerM
LAFAVLLAVLLLPLVNFLESRNVPRILFIAISLFLAIIAGVGNTFRR